MEQRNAAPARADPAVTTLARELATAGNTRPWLERTTAVAEKETDHTPLGSQLRRGEGTDGGGREGGCKWVAGIICTWNQYLPPPGTAPAERGLQTQQIGLPMQGRRHRLHRCPKHRGGRSRRAPPQCRDEALFAGQRNPPRLAWPHDLLVFNFVTKPRAARPRRQAGRQAGRQYGRGTAQGGATLEKLGRQAGSQAGTPAAGRGQAPPGGAASQGCQAASRQPSQAAS